MSELTCVDVSQPSRVASLLAEAMEKRSVGCTQLNEQSSRSHMVFTLKASGCSSQLVFTPRARAGGCSGAVALTLSR